MIEGSFNTLPAEEFVLLVQLLQRGVLLNQPEKFHFFHTCLSRVWMKNLNIQTCKRLKGKLINMAIQNPRIFRGSPLFFFFFFFFFSDKTTVNRRKMKMYLFGFNCDGFRVFEKSEFEQYGP